MKGLIIIFKLDIENGKYTFINDNGVVSILRHGEAWRNDTGDKALLCLLQRTEDYRNEIVELRSNSRLACPNCYEYCDVWTSESTPCGDDW